MAFRSRKDDSTDAPSGTRGGGSGRAGHRVRLGYFEDFTTKTLTYAIDKSVKMATVRRGSVDDVREWFQLEEIDVALLPAWDFMKVGRLSMVPGSCLSVVGPSNMFLLCSKVLPTEIRGVLADHESYGGRSLAEILLPSQTGIHPEFTRSSEPLTPEFDFEGSEYDAFLLTAENALLADKSRFTWVYDLGGAWHSTTNAPFVMHVWGCRRGIDLRGVEKEIVDAARASMTFLAEVVGKEQERLGIASGLDLVYQKLLKTDCGPTEIAALRRYAQELAKVRLCRNPQFQTYRPPAAVGGAGFAVR